MPENSFESRYMSFKSWSKLSLKQPWCCRNVQNLIHNNPNNQQKWVSLGKMLTGQPFHFKNRYFLSQITLQSLTEQHY